MSQTLTNLLTIAAAFALLGSIADFLGGHSFYWPATAGYAALGAFVAWGWNFDITPEDTTLEDHGR